MSGQSLRNVILGVVVGALGSVVLFGIVRGRSNDERRPVIAGQQVPERRFRLDFSKRYDLIVGQRFHEEVTRTIEGVRILGFTSLREDEAETKGVKDAQTSNDYFDHWIVGELRDGRLTYVPPGTILSVQESAQEAPFK